MIERIEKFLKRRTGSSPSEIEGIVSKLYEYGFIKVGEANTLVNYRNELKHLIEYEEEYFETTDPEVAEAFVSYIKEEYEKVQYVPTGYITSILSMQGQFERPFILKSTGYSNNSFFEFKKLVEMVNAYWEIDNPYKPSNKIAYGWNFCMEKSNPKAYLYACIRNYLLKNEVEFELIDVKRICKLADIWEDY